MVGAAPSTFNCPFDSIYAGKQHSDNRACSGGYSTVDVANGDCPTTISLPTSDTPNSHCLRDYQWSFDTSLRLLYVAPTTLNAGEQATGTALYHVRKTQLPHAVLYDHVDLQLTNQGNCDGHILSIVLQLIQLPVVPGSASVVIASVGIENETAVRGSDTPGETTRCSSTGSCVSSVFFDAQGIMGLNLSDPIHVVPAHTTCDAVHIVPFDYQLLVPLTAFETPQNQYQLRIDVTSDTCCSLPFATCAVDIACNGVYRPLRTRTILSLPFALSTALLDSCDIGCDRIEVFYQFPTFPPTIVPCGTNAPVLPSNLSQIIDRSSTVSANIPIACADDTDINVGGLPFCQCTTSKNYTLSTQAWLLPVLGDTSCQHPLSQRPLYDPQLIAEGVSLVCTPPSAQDCIVSSWSEWTPDGTPTNFTTCLDTVVRQRSISTLACWGGEACPNLEESSTVLNTSCLLRPDPLPAFCWYSATHYANLCPLDKLTTSFCVAAIVDVVPEASQPLVISTFPLIQRAFQSSIQFYSPEQLATVLSYATMFPADPAFGGVHYDRVLAPNVSFFTSSDTPGTITAANNTIFPSKIAIVELTTAVVNLRLWQRSHTTMPILSMQPECKYRNDSILFSYFNRMPFKQIIAILTYEITIGMKQEYGRLPFFSNETVSLIYLVCDTFTYMSSDNTLEGCNSYLTKEAEETIAQVGSDSSLAVYLPNAVHVLQLLNGFFSHGTTGCTNSITSYDEWTACVVMQ